MERDSYTAGTPSWVDLGSPDVDASVAFYAGLFGWEVAPEDPEMGGYRLAMLGGKPVAGMAPLQGPVPAWTTYMATDDADGFAAAVKDNGGTVMMEPMDVTDLGRMAIASDPEGAVFGVWQAGSFCGAALVNETGTLGWNELWTRNAEQAKAFYPAVFGYAIDEESMPGYIVWQLDGQPVGGCTPMPEDLPARVPAHWAVYFGVDDVDVASDKVTELGGMVVAPPFDAPGVGRIAMVHGPDHESFAIITPTPQA